MIASSATSIKRSGTAEEKLVVLYDSFNALKPEKLKCVIRDYSVSIAKYYLIFVHLELSGHSLSRSQGKSEFRTDY